MGFILEGLDAEDYDRQYDNKELIRRIIAYFRPYRKQVAAATAMMSINAVMGISIPIIISSAIDLIASRPDVNMIWLSALAILLLGGCAWLFHYGRMLLSARINGDVVLNMRRDIVAAALQHDLAFFHDHPSGKIVSRITSDTQDFSEVVTLVMDLLGQMMLVILIVSWLFFIDVRLTLLMIAFIPAAVLMALSFRKIARKVTQQARRVTALINAEIQESISGITVAKNFRQEEAIYRAFDQNNQEAYQYGLRRGLVMSSVMPVVSSTSSIGLAAVVLVGGLAVNNQRLSIGDYYLFMQSLVYVWWPMLNIASFWSQFQDGLSAAERVFALMDAESTIIQTDSRHLTAPQGCIEFKQVNFSYNGQEQVLSNFSLLIQPHEKAALVGHTGAGKSSIAKLIARFYEFDQGELLIDGQNIRSLDLKHYRRHIGIVPQEPFLFSGTVADNIRYGKPEASESEIFEAAARIGDGGWITSLRQGLQTDVGERGAALSLGQRQLVALARVLLKNPLVFILDEATASVDPFTEIQIQQGLETVMRQRTAIVIAHRLSTVRRADRIIVIEHGQIIEQGNHEQLMANGGNYATLYQTFFRHQTMEYVEAAGREHNT